MQRVNGMCRESVREARFALKMHFARAASLRAYLAPSHPLNIDTLIISFTPSPIHSVIITVATSLFITSNVSFCPG